MNTTAGSYVLLEYAGEAKGDAFVVKRLRDAGAIILAKANLDEVSICFSSILWTVLIIASGPVSVA